MKTDVLIVGAGPVGLTLGIILARAGINFKIIDKDAQWPTQSRAISITARTLEHLHIIGVTDRLIKSGIPCPRINYYYKNHLIGRADFTQLKSIYKFILQIPQPSIIAELSQKLLELGVEVDRPAEFLSFEKNGELIQAKIKNKNQQIDTINTQYLIACDGSRSTVREKEAIQFVGETHGDTFLETDIELKNFPYANNERHYFILARSLLATIPLPHMGSTSTYRVISFKSYKTTYSEQETLDILKKQFIQVGLPKVQFGTPIWTKNYNPRQFVVSSFYHNHIAYAGDAAHIQSPIGAQGLNTGIQDIFNLAWKLIFVLQHNFADRLLITYHQDRYPIAIKLFNYNEKQRNFFVRSNALLKLIYLFLKFLNHLKYFNTKEIEQASQLNVHYPKPMAKEQNKLLKPGHRFPYVKLGNIITIYDLIKPDKFLALFFTNGEIVDQELTLLHSLQPLLNTVVISDKHNQVKESSVLDDPDKKIHNLFDIKNKTVCLIRPDTYIELFSVGPSITTDLQNYFQKTIYGAE